MKPVFAKDIVRFPSRGPNLFVILLKFLFDVLHFTKYDNYYKSELKTKLQGNIFVNIIYALFLILCYSNFQMYDVGLRFLSVRRALTSLSKLLYLYWLKFDCLKRLRVK